MLINLRASQLQNPEFQNFAFERNTAITLRFRLTTPANVAGFTTTLEVRTTTNEDTNTFFTSNGTISNAVLNAASVGVFDVTLTAANTLAFDQGQDYYFKFKRT